MMAIGLWSTHKDENKLFWLLFSIEIPKKNPAQGGVSSFFATPKIRIRLKRFMCS